MHSVSEFLEGLYCGVLGTRCFMVSLSFKCGAHYLCLESVPVLYAERLDSFLCFELLRIFYFTPTSLYQL